LLFLTQPAHLQASVGEKLSEDEKNYYRAQKICSRLKGERTDIKKMEDSEQEQTG